IRLRALRVFERLTTRGHIPSPAPVTPPQRKMTMLLKTLDGLAQGWSQRQIAMALFGEKAVAAEWGGRSDFLKSRVRRMITWAETLSGDAYLGLLRR
ncbi:MAG: DNA -binding domain-containing protein, partial [Sphingomonas oligoaromativorans]